MQSAQERLAGDARVKALQGRLLWLIVIAGSLATVLGTQAVLQLAFLGSAEVGSEAIKIDFRIFWAAATLALQGEPLAAFDMARLGAVHNIDPGAWMPWLYPPGYLVLLMPFGAVPFAFGFLISTVLSVVLVAMAVRPFVAGSAPIWIAMTLAPAYLPTLYLGQNSLFWLAGLIAALAALQGRRWVLAGVFIGLLTLKPQLGLLLPVALVAAGLWRTILAATCTAILLAVLPTLYFGIEYWTLLADRLSEHRESLLFSLPDLFMMVNPLFLWTLLGLSPETAMHIQWVVIALSAGIVAVLWRSKAISFDAKVAGLLLAMLLSAPYLWYYEVAMMPMIGLCLVRAGVIGRSGPQVLLLFFLWLGGALQAVNGLVPFIDGRLIGATIITPVLVASMVILLLHVVAANRRYTQQQA
jgi:hypothetical protein